jgi:hypothetical protein
MTERCVVGICYNGNSLFLLWQFAAQKGARLHCYVPPTLMPLAENLGIRVKRIRYAAILIDILTSFLLVRRPLLVLPHAGGRFLRVLRRVFRVKLFVDDGFLYLGYDDFLKTNDTVVTFSEIGSFRSAEQAPCRCETPASLLDYARVLKGVPAPLITQPTHVVVSSSELDDGALQALVDHPPTGSDLRYIPHPRAYKNRAVFRSLRPLHPSVEYGADAVILNNLDVITGVTTARSFTSYLLVAWLASQGKSRLVDIHRPVNCTKHFAELHEFCDWLVAHGGCPT